MLDRAFVLLSIPVILYAVIFIAGAGIGYILSMKRKVHGLPHRSRPQLHDAITHIAYEYVGLERALAAFRRPQSQGGQRRFDLEAALVHARNLTEFFWAPSRRRRSHRDGVYAAHYLPTPDSWGTIRTALTQLPNERFDAISSQLAHISTARSKKGTRDFESEVIPIANALNQVWQRWTVELQGTEWPPLLDAEVASYRAKP